MFSNNKFLDKLFGKPVPLTEYHILYNGLRYRVEQKIRYKRWGNITDRWQPVVWFYNHVYEFDDLDKAQKWIDKNRQETEAEQRGWRIVEEKGT